MFDSTAVTSPRPFTNALYESAAQETGEEAAAV